MRGRKHVEIERKGGRNPVSLALICVLALGIVLPMRTGHADEPRRGKSWRGDFQAIVFDVRAQTLTIDDLQQLADAGRHGDAGSAQLLAWLLATGKEVRLNLRLAAVWYLQSYLDGMPQSLRDARLVLRHLGPQEIRSLNPAILALAETGQLNARPLSSDAPDALEVRSILREEAVNAHLVPALAEAVGYVESRFHAGAVSNKGALGIMQIMPATGAAFQVAPAGLFDVRTNIRTGVKYLTQLVQQYGRVDKALAHYVGGTAAAMAYPAVSGEVQKYVADVMSAAPQFAALNGAPLPRSGITPPVIVRKPGISPALMAQIAAVPGQNAPIKNFRKTITRQGSVLILRGGSDG